MLLPPREAGRWAGGGREILIVNRKRTAGGGGSPVTNLNITAHYYTGRHLSAPLSAHHSDPLSALLSAPPSAPLSLSLSPFFSWAYALLVLSFLCSPFLCSPPPSLSFLPSAPRLCARLSAPIALRSSPSRHTSIFWENMEAICGCVGLHATERRACMKENGDTSLVSLTFLASPASLPSLATFAFSASLAFLAFLASIASYFTCRRLYS